MTRGIAGATTTSASELPPDEAAERGRWLVRLRWGALALGAVALGGASAISPHTLGPGRGAVLALVLGVLALANAVLDARLRLGVARTRDLFAAIAVDVVAVTVALHVTGGIENPFQVYYIFPVIIAGIALPQPQSYTIAALATGLFAALGLLEYTHTLPHHDVSHLPLFAPIGPQTVDQYEDPRYLAGASFVLLSTLLGATYLTTAVATRLRGHERALWLAKERLEGILRALGEGVAYFDASGELVLANEAFERLLGVDPRSGRASRLRELGPAELKAPLEAALGSIERGAAFETFEGRAGERVLASGLSPVRGAGGVAWVVEDVTERRRAEERAGTERRLVDLGVLAAGIAHEVLNPLASISSSAQLIEAEAPGEGLGEPLGAIRRQVDRITRIVRGVADLARPSGSRLSPVPLEEILVDAVARAREERPGSGEVALELARPGPSVGVAGEPMRVAVKNLVTNALDAAGETGRVVVRARHEGAEVIVEVEDDGPGIDARELESIFVPFYTTKAPGRGAGLGLPIAASIVRHHGGRISVASPPGRGARFLVHLPVAPLPAVALPAAPLSTETAT